MDELKGPDICHCFGSRRSARWLARHYDNALAPSGLTIAQFSILTMLEHHERLKISRLGELMVMERTSLMRALKSLVDLELVVSHSVPGDRAREFSLTSEGSSKLSDASPLWVEAQKNFEKAIGHDTAENLRRQNLAVASLSY